MVDTRWRVALIGVTDVLALVLLRPDLGDLARDVSSPGRRLSSIGSDQVLAEVVGAALWLLAAWVAVGLLALIGARLPGTLGRGARHVGRIAVPRAIVGLLAGSAGLGVLLAPVAAGAVPSPAWPSAPAPPSSSTHVPAPVWPNSATAQGHATPRGRVTPRTTPAEPPKSPTSTSPTSTSPTLTSPTSTPDPDRSPNRAAHPVSSDAPTTSAPTVVRTGDSLWLLAAHRLGTDATSARIAEYWPQVYAANRAVVGADPSLIIPGQRLIEPAPTTQESTP